MTDTTTSPVLGTPILDLPFPRRIPEETKQAAPARAPRGTAMALPSAKKTIVGVMPTSDEEDGEASRPTVPDAPIGRARPGRTKVGGLMMERPRVGRTIVGVGPAVDTMVSAADDTPSIVTEPVRVQAAPVEEEPAMDRPFQPSAYARDPGLGAAESIRLPRRRIEAGDWLMLAVIVGLLAAIVYLLV